MEQARYNPRGVTNILHSLSVVDQDDASFDVSKFFWYYHADAAAGKNWKKVTASRLADVIAGYLAVGTTLVNKLDATTDPTTGDDISFGFTKNSIWFNTATQSFWACQSNTLGAAVWIEGAIGGTGLQNDMNSAVIPDATFDAGQGWSEGSCVYHVPTSTLYFCRDAGTDDDAVWFAYATSTSVDLSFPNTLFVDNISGLDSTAVVGNPLFPYQTLTAAIADHTSNRSIIVMPTPLLTETTTMVLKDGLNIQFLGSGRLETVAGFNLFEADDNITCNISASAWTFNGTGLKGIFDAQGYTNVNLTFEFDKCLTEYGEAFVLDCDSSRLVFKGNRVYGGVDGGSCFTGYSQLNGSEVFIDVDDVSLDGTDVPVFLFAKGNIFVHVKNSQAPLGSCIYVNDTNAGCKMFFQVDRINCGGGDWPVWFYGLSTHMAFHNMELIGASDCLLVTQGSGSGALHAYCDRIHSTYVGTQDGIVHAEGSTMYLNGATITRAASATGGGDIKTSGTTPHMYLKGVSYDVTRIKVNTKGQAEYWNGAGYTDIPHVINNPVGSGNVITDNVLTSCTINFAGFTACTLSNMFAVNHTFTFSGNAETQTNQGWISTLQITAV